jgi:hypothetical protein
MQKFRAEMYALGCKYSQSPTYVVIALRGALRESKIMSAGMSVNAHAAIATMLAEFDSTKKEPISKKKM